jgi:hypothetical protein
MFRSALFEIPKNKDLKHYSTAILVYQSIVTHTLYRQGADKEGRTIAVNYWFDMEFDLKYCYYKMLENTIQDFKSRKNTSNNSANNMNNTRSNTN